MARPGLKFDILNPPKPAKEKAKAVPFLHYCHCGAWGAFGYGRRVETSTWYCHKHRPDDAERAA